MRKRKRCTCEKRKSVSLVPIFRPVLPGLREDGNNEEGVERDREDEGEFRCDVLVGESVKESNYRAENPVEE